MADLRPLSAAYGGGPSGYDVHLGRPKTDFELKNLEEKKKKMFSAPPHVMPLGPFDLLACTISFFFFLGGTLIYVVGMNNILKGALSAAAGTADC